ncbi:putative ring-cleavage extradiol dioxygenase [Rubidibacter lacunae KORDI 51-2]|uniref:Putative ring-cleavage extradiol dioxygenase n=2 Tax=Rubidibacter TaxID=582491 RepID=U5DAX4_9CHRO|nr:putative ring-cleavage extradiol dioxygenase [Rubidibacter lacunae KORDI 51-2]
MYNNARNGRISGLNAVIFIANDFEGQCKFYEETLGLELASRQEDAAFFKIGNQTLGIFARSHHPEGTKRLGDATHGISHLEFLLAEADLEKTIAKLKATGAHAYGDNFADADGNLFHFKH